MTKKSEILRREDIYEYNELEKIIDIGTIPFMNLTKVCIDFILNEFLTKDTMQKLNIDDKTKIKARHYMLQAKAYFSEKTITKETLKEERISCWEAHDKCGYESTQRKLLRLIVCFLYDEESTAEEAKHAQDDELSIIFNCLYELGSGYCKQLRLYLQKNLIQ